MWWVCFNWLCRVHVQVIAPEEIIDPSVDEQSVMTYLSQFPKAKLKAGAPLKPKLNPKKARAYGPGRPQRRGGRPGRATWENTPRASLLLAVGQFLRCCDNRRKGTAVETKEKGFRLLFPRGFRCWFRCSGLNREFVKNKKKSVVQISRVDSPTPGQLPKNLTLRDGNKVFL